MKKQIEISKLMDSYTDDEFNIEGTESAGLQEVRSKVMEQVKNKKSLKLSKKLLIIAAAVVGVSAITAATLPYGIFNSQTGGEYSFEKYKTDIKEPTGDEVPPYTIKDGRVYFTVNNENIDITDKISENNFWFYQYADTDNQGNEIICVYGVCGDIDDLSYGESVFRKNEGTLFVNGAGQMYGGCEPYCYYKNGEIIMVNDKEAPDYEEKRAEYNSYPHRVINAPWHACYMNAEREWYNTLFDGKELDVTKSDTSITGGEEITEWLYPEGWTGERLSEDM